jgi:hypothetical protein
MRYNINGADRLPESDQLDAARPHPTRPDGFGTPPGTFFNDNPDGQSLLDKLAGGGSFSSDVESADSGPDGPYGSAGGM